MSEIFGEVLGPTENWKPLPPLFLISANSSYPPESPHSQGSEPSETVLTPHLLLDLFLPAPAALGCMNPTHLYQAASETEFLPRPERSSVLSNIMYFLSLLS